MNKIIAIIAALVALATASPVSATTTPYVSPIGAVVRTGVGIFVKCYSPLQHRAVWVTPYYPPYTGVPGIGNIQYGNGGWNTVPQPSYRVAVSIAAGLHDCQVMSVR